ncbi:uncharacterized protein LOC126782703 [Argentina anserina]|uniref:uncharacterized protein LOC126782703 n=1 Tax=Argentina anserina TaxID=57926 RepID=UPI002176442E|nr:uncharacterized protein LOC126782703 [Potentilla anserina]
MFPSKPSLYIKQLQPTDGQQLIILSCTLTASINSSTLSSKSQREMAFHTRSNSFPSRPHPILQEVDEHLCRLRSSEATSTSSSSISHKLSGLQDLHECVDRLLQLPLHQALAQEQHQKWANELLDGSLQLLDVCSVAKDALSQTKECIQDLQSIIRRRHGDESAVLTSEARKYLTSRKTVRKVLHKALDNLKACSSFNKEEVTIVCKLREVAAVTVSVFESVLSFISGPSKPSSWSLVSKIVQLKKVACEEEAKVNEFAEVDAALKSLKSAHNQLNNLESCIQDQEEGLETLFRQLLKTRVSLLNILNH